MWQIKDKTRTLCDKRKTACIYRILYFSVCFFFLFTIEAKAYIDPSVMTYAIQAIAGIAIALGTFFNIYWRKIRKKIGWNGLFSTKYSKTESDDLYFDDPVSHQHIQPELNTEPETHTVKEREPFLRNFWGEYKYALILAASVSFLVMIFSPLDLYFNNVKEFWFDFGIACPILIKSFILCFLGLSAIFLVCLLLFDELYHVIYIGVFAAFICAYIQGNFLAGKLPSLDGSEIDWSLYHTQMLQSRYLWSLLPLAILLVARFVRMKGFYKITKYVNLTVSAMLAVSLLTVGIKNNGFLDKNYRIATADHLFEMSEKQNFIILMIDALDARVFEQVLEDNPEYLEYFEDFTFFPDTVGAYTFTSYALPQILTGEWMENQTDYQSYLSEAMDKAPLFADLKEKDYRMGMYETNLFYDSDNIFQFENIQEADVSFKSKDDFLETEKELFIFKYAPYQLKRNHVPDMLGFYRTQAINGESEIFSDNNDYFYEKIQSEPIVMTQDKCFRFIHIEGAHVPFRYNKNVERIDTADGSYEQNVLCSITIMNAYLDALKEAGVYDNSAIIIMGDHGFNYDNDEYWGRWNPALLIKGINEHHDYTESLAPLSYADLQEAYRRLTDGMPAEECFDAKEGDTRERRYMHFIREAKITEYMQTGYASNEETLIPTGKVFERAVDYLAEFHIN